ncbi:MFS transporter [Flavobacteriaceae bacterium MHTCC 0001]
MQLFSALQYKNYRVFIIGQALSNIGNMMHFVAVSWLAYTLTDSVFMLGLITIGKQMSGFFVGFFSGVIADRFNRRVFLQYAHFFIGCIAFITFALVWFELITIQLLLIAQLLTGILKGLEIPSRQSFVNDMIPDKQHLPNAVALNSTVFNTTRLIGPTVAGILIPLVGEAICLSVYGVMSWIIVVFFFSIKVPKQKKIDKKLNFKSEFFEGLNYAFSYPPIKISLILVAFFAFFGTSFMVLLPVIAGEVYNSGAEIFGYLNSAQGLGAIIGGMYLANRGKATNLHNGILWATVIFCAGLGVLSFSNLITIAFIGIILTGLGRVVVFASTNTLLQLISNDEKRGRVLSLYITIFMGAMMLGGLSMSALADYIGVLNTLKVQAVFCLVTALFYAKNLKYFKTTELTQKLQKI